MENLGEVEAPRSGDVARIAAAASGMRTAILTVCTTLRLSAGNEQIVLLMLLLLLSQGAMAEVDHLTLPVGIAATCPTKEEDANLS